MGGRGGEWPRRPRQPHATDDLPLDQDVQPPAVLHAVGVANADHLPLDVIDLTPAGEVVGADTIAAVRVRGLPPLSGAAPAGRQGVYELIGLRPGANSITQTQPDGFVDGRESLGPINGRRSGDASLNGQFRGVSLAEPGVHAVNANLGERPPADNVVRRRPDGHHRLPADTNGRALIGPLNGGWRTT